VIGALSTFWIIIFTFHSKESKFGIRASNYIYLGAAWLAVISTVVIIAKTRSIDAEKDKQIGLFQSEAAIQIQQLKTVAAQAIQKAEEAKGKVEDTAKENSLLRIKVAKDEIETKKATTELSIQAQKSDQFVQTLAEQQHNMETQIKPVPSLSDQQIKTMAAELKPFAGQSVTISMMLDVHCARLGDQFHKVLDQAGIKVSGYGTVVGPLYQGISVVVRNPSPNPHPPLADALLKAMASAGINAKGVAERTIHADEVGIYIGPE
jgi:hypothetical protein